MSLGLPARKQMIGTAPAPSRNGKRLGLALLALPALMAVGDTWALPARIIILRHGEKMNGYELCSVGQQRSLALRAQYLGKDAADTLFPHTKPAAFFSITLHSLELAAPAAESWAMPLIDYSVVPLPDQTDEEKTLQLNRRTQQAAREVLTASRWHGKTVVMSWEHKHIANKKLEADYPGQKVTLRQLLHLDKIRRTEVPSDWPGDNYDYFWIVKYGNRTSSTPTSFESIRQVFDPPYQAVPSNIWGEPEDLSGTDCEQ